MCLLPGQTLSDPFRPLQTLLDPFRPLQTLFDPCRPLQTLLNPFRPLQTLLKTLFAPFDHFIALSYGLVDAGEHYVRSQLPSSLESSKRQTCKEQTKNYTGKMCVRLNYAKSHNHSIQIQVLYIKIKINLNKSSLAFVRRN